MTENIIIVVGISILPLLIYIAHIIDYRMEMKMYEKYIDRLREEQNENS